MIYMVGRKCVAGRVKTCRSREKISASRVKMRESREKMLGR